MAGFAGWFPATSGPILASAKKEKLLRRLETSYPREDGRRFEVSPAAGFLYTPTRAARRVWRRVGRVWWWVSVLVCSSYRCKRVRFRGTRFGRRLNPERIVAY